MQKTFYSFGVDSPYKHYHIEVRHEDDHDPRHAVISAHGSKWSMEYPEDEWLRTSMSTTTTCMLRMTVDEHRMTVSEVFPDA